MCCVRGCAIPGTVLLFTLAKQTREFHLETQCTPGKIVIVSNLKRCCLPPSSVLCTVRLALLVFAFLSCDRHPSYSLCASLPIFSLSISLLPFPFVALFPSAALFLSLPLPLSLSLSLSVCLSKRQISSLGETLEDSPSVYK